MNNDELRKIADQVDAGEDYFAPDDEIGALGFSLSGRTVVRTRFSEPVEFVAGDSVEVDQVIRIDATTGAVLGVPQSLIVKHGADGSTTVIDHSVECP